MVKARSKKRINGQRNTVAPNMPLGNTQHSKHPPARRQQVPWSRRFLNRLAAANKAVLAAIGAGLLGAITGAVIGLSHLIASTVLGSGPPLTVAGGNSMFMNSCFSGDFAVPGMLHLASTVSPDQMAALTKNAADASPTSATYTLQASPGQTVVITGIHTILLKRTPAPRATEIDVSSDCAGAATIYNLTINLDNTNQAPAIQTQDPDNPEKTIEVHALQTAVTNADPIIINIEGNTTKYDVTWKLLIEYTVNGQSRAAWIANGSQPFHTIAGRRDDLRLSASPNSEDTAWMVRNGSQGQ